jgi:hypothetical protein
VLDAGGINPSGTYTLMQLDGRLLPAAIATGFTARGAVELKGNNHFTVTQTDSVGGTPTSTSVSGSWTINDNAVQLIPDGGGLLLGVVAFDTLRMDYRGHTNTYVRH